MKADLTSDLIRDAVLDQARSRRQRRVLQTVALVLLPLSLAFFLLQPGYETPAVAGASPADEEEEKPGFTTISTDDELLDRLAHLGPVIVTRVDGSQWLYLTKN
jgi:hypothetical protein